MNDKARNHKHNHQFAGHPAIYDHSFSCRVISDRCVYLHDTWLSFYCRNGWGSRHKPFPYIFRKLSGFLEVFKDVVNKIFYISLKNRVSNALRYICTEMYLIDPIYSEDRSQVCLLCGHQRLAYLFIFIFNCLCPRGSH